MSDPRLQEKIEANSQKINNDWVSSMCVYVEVISK
jgi:hypothetical protein